MHRIPACDGLRGFLALAVVLDHAFGRMAQAGAGGALVRGGAIIFGGAGGIAVCIFFVISAYVLTRAWDARFIAFLARRMVRLWPTYAICLLAGYAVLGRAPLWSEFIFYPVASSAGDPPSWSLCVEAWGMMFMPIIVWSAIGDRWRLIAAIGIWLALCVVNLKFSMGGFFLAGAAFHKYAPRAALLETPLPQWLGKISYSLYLIHWPVLALMAALGPFGFVVAVPMTLVAAAYLERYVERPSILMSRRVGALRVWRQRLQTV